MRSCLLMMLTLVAGSMLVHEAKAQGQWTSGGSFTFQSDIDRQRKQREAKRAERRKNYRVSYPKYMKGGAKPDISPEKPDIVYLERSEKPGTIIVDTSGRRLLYVLPDKQAYAYPISVGRQR